MKNCCVLNEKLSEESINIELKDNHDKSEAYIEQNNPNPFYENTVIKYFLPKNFGKAQISFSDLNGQILKTIHLQNDGLGTISLSARELAAGTYTYTLILDGRIIDTKKMVLTR